MIPTEPMILRVDDGDTIGEMEFNVSVQCANCKNRIENLQCKAFKDLIPEEIYTGAFDHTNPHSGDNGIRFEPIEQ